MSNDESEKTARVIRIFADTYDELQAQMALDPRRPASFAQYVGWVWEEWKQFKTENAAKAKAELLSQPQVPDHDEATVPRAVR